jgi:hypothetical protein
MSTFGNQSQLIKYRVGGYQLNVMQCSQIVRGPSNVNLVELNHDVILLRCLALILLALRHEGDFIIIVVLTFTLDVYERLSFLLDLFCCCCTALLRHN